MLVDSQRELGAKQGLDLWEAPRPSSPQVGSRLPVSMSTRWSSLTSSLSGVSFSVGYTGLPTRTCCSQNAVGGASVQVISVSATLELGHYDWSPSSHSGS